MAFPRTPQRVAPNSARKRRQVLDLSRQQASPSHGERMSMIFKDASANLKGIRTPPPGPLPNTKVSRLPLSQTRSVRFGSISRDKEKLTSPGLRRQTQPLQACTAENNADSIIGRSTQSDSSPVPSLHDYPTPNREPCMNNGPYHKDAAREPISSGFTSPSILYSQPPKTPEEVKYPNFEQYPTFQSSSPPVGTSLSKSGSHATSSDSPTSVTLPRSLHRSEITSDASIETWLNGVQLSFKDADQFTMQHEAHRTNIASSDEPQIPPNAPSPKFPRQRAAFAPRKEREAQRSDSSNKENVSPIKSASSLDHTCIPFLAATPPNFRNSNIQATTDANALIPFTQPRTPQGYLSVPPKRKKARINGKTKPKSQGSPKDFRIHDDQVADALMQLSPDVELHRKGRRPKRDRCVSYWDHDILSMDSPCQHTEPESISVPMRKGKRVLGETQQSAELTKSKAFAAEVENAEFAILFR